MKQFELVRNVRIQYLRALAASSVLVAHAAAAVGGSGWISLIDGRFGIYGVSIFFAISGWIMATLVRANDPFLFILHRVLRIYPTYVLVILLAAALGGATGFGVGINPLALLLVPDDQIAFPIGVEWTLVYEVTYYVLLFGLALAGAVRWLEAIAVVWAAGILCFHALSPGLDDSVTGTFPVNLLLTVNMSFAGGLLLPWLIRRGLVPRASALLILPCLVVYGFFGIQTNQLISSVGSLGLVAWAVQSPRSMPASAVGRAAARLGDWSYALYLCHAPVIFVIMAWLPGRLDNTIALWAVAVLASLAVCAPIGMIDVTLYRRLKRWADGARASVRQWAGGVFAAGYGLTAVVIGTSAALVQRTLFQLDSVALRSDEAANRTLRDRGLFIGARFSGRLESVEGMDTGQSVVSGWAVDRATPSERFRVRVFCDGRPIAGRPAQRRSRPDVAEELGEPRLRGRKIGLSVVSTAAAACPAGAPTILLAFDRYGKAAALTGTWPQPASPGDGAPQGAAAQTGP